MTGAENMDSGDRRSSDPGIICFQHCGPKVFCVSFPDQCPSCKQDLDKASFKLMPFRLPFPFIRASQYPGSVILRPTHGDFLNDYMNSKDLHIGVTTSTGAIVEFDRQGLKTQNDKTSQNKWAQSLLVEQIPEAWSDHWDATLFEICKQSVWNTSSYREETNNCYSFVLTFLQELNYGVLSGSAKNKTLFCEKYIVPRTTAAGKYISLYRKIRDQGLYLHSSPTSVAGGNGGGGGSGGGSGGGGGNNGGRTTNKAGGSSDRKGGSNTSSFNINGKLCSIRE